jgi:urea transport system substrate-binding protein
MPTRRRFLRNASLTAAAAIAAPSILIPSAREARGATLQTGKPIKVGVLFSLTGGLVVPEEDSALVMQYAIDEINAAGGINGSPIEPIIIDAMSDMNVYAQRMRELIMRDKVISVFGCYTSASRKAVLPTVMSQNNLLFYPTCYEGAECSQNIVCTGPLANQHSKDLIPYMVENFGKRVFFVGSNYV